MACSECWNSTLSVKIQYTPNCSWRRNDSSKRTGLRRSSTGFPLAIHLNSIHCKSPAAAIQVLYWNSVLSVTRRISQGLHTMQAINVASRARSQSIFGAQRKIARVSERAATEEVSA